jgi:hypothetical protein
MTEKLAYQLELSDTEGIRLHPETQPISNVLWQNLALNVAKEVSLTSYPPQVLAERWEQGRAAIAFWRGEIVSYISVVPIFIAPTRLKLAEIMGLHPEQFPNIDINESATGWTQPAWRRRGLSFQLRQRLLGRFGQTNRLYVTIAVGLGAAPVVTRLGWQLVPWGEVTYVSSMVGLPQADVADKIKIGRRLPPGMKLYRGAAALNENHPWEQFCHFWVSDLALASQLNLHLATLLEQDLRRWREVYATMLMREANPTWKPFLFDEDFG